MSLEDMVREALARLRDRAALLGGPADITETFSDADDYPTFDSDADANYDRGWIEGAAAAHDMTVLELLDELGLH